MQLVVFCTTKDKDEAQRLSKILLENRVCACVNISENISSLYLWEEQVQSESECLMVIKTSSRVYDKLEEMIKKNHSYDVPEVIAMPIIKGSREYLDWIEEETKDI